MPVFSPADTADTIAIERLFTSPSFDPPNIDFFAGAAAGAAAPPPDSASAFAVSAAASGTRDQYRI